MAVNDLRSHVTDRFRTEKYNTQRKEAHLTELKKIKGDTNSATIEAFKKQMRDCYDVEMLIAIADAFKDQLLVAAANEEFTKIFHAELEAWLAKHKMLSQQLADVIKMVPAAVTNVDSNEDNLPVATAVTPATVNVQGKAVLAEVIFSKNAEASWTSKDFLNELAKPTGVILSGLVKAAEQDQQYLARQKVLILQKDLLTQAKDNIFRIPLLGALFSESRDRSFVKKVISALQQADSIESPLTITTGFPSKTQSFNRNELLVLIRSNPSLHDAFKAELAYKPWAGQQLTLSALFGNDEKAKALFANGDDYSAAAEALLPSLTALNVVQAQPVLSVTVVPEVAVAPHNYRTMAIVDPIVQRFAPLSQPVNFTQQSSARTLFQMAAIAARPLINTLFRFIPKNASPVSIINPAEPSRQLLITEHAATASSVEAMPVASEVTVDNVHAGQVQPFVDAANFDDLSQANSIEIAQENTEEEQKSAYLSLENLLLNQQSFQLYFEEITSDELSSVSDSASYDDSVFNQSVDGESSDCSITSGSDVLNDSLSSEDKTSTSEATSAETNFKTPVKAVRAKSPLPLSPESAHNASISSGSDTSSANTNAIFNRTPSDDGISDTDLSDNSTVVLNKTPSDDGASEADEQTLPITPPGKAVTNSLSSLIKGRTYNSADENDENNSPNVDPFVVRKILFNDNANLGYRQ